MDTYYDNLRKKGVELRRAWRPNSIEVSDDGVWVIVERRDGSERARFLVDEDAYEHMVAPYRWHVGSVTGDRVYTSARIPTGSGNSTVLLARWLMNPPADAEVDHINKNPLDNRRENLRVVTRKQNEENGGQRRSPRKFTSEHRGVYLDPYTKRWRAEVTHHGKAHKSPRFDTEAEAAEWARAKRLELFTHNDEDTT